VALVHRRRGSTDIGGYDRISGRPTRAERSIGDDHRPEPEPVITAIFDQLGLQEPPKRVRRAVLLVGFIVAGNGQRRSIRGQLQPGAAGERAQGEDYAQEHGQQRARGCEAPTRTEGPQGGRTLLRSSFWSIEFTQ
jgi:hypothetical protein